MKLWRNYWFAPSPLLDLAVVRIVCCSATILYCFVYHDYFAVVAERFILHDTMFRPIFLLKVLHAPLGWGYSGNAGVDGLGIWAVRPGETFVQAITYVFLISGVTSAFGFLSRISLALFAFSFFYIQGYIYSFGDFHHPEAAMLVMVTALALSPAGGVMSIDNWLRRRRFKANDLLALSDQAGWAIKMMMWFFALMYFSAFVAKLSIGGINWMNGYTLQFFLIQDGLRHGRDIAVWAAQFHWLILLGQWAVMAFQATFFLEVIFPKLRWLYIPVGFSLHVTIYVLQGAPFFTWMALYSIFIPWSVVFIRMKTGSRPQVA